METNMLLDEGLWDDSINCTLRNGNLRRGSHLKALMSINCTLRNGNRYNVCGRQSAGRY